MSEHNPKYVEALKRGKIDYSTVPWSAVVGVAQAMMEGAGKYGRFNYRQDKIEARTYIAAILRHLLGDPSTGSVGWVNGEDIDEESGLHHLHKVMACCALVIDAQDHGMLIDNRLTTESLTPPSARAAHVDEYGRHIMSDSDRDDMLDVYAKVAKRMKVGTFGPVDLNYAEPLDIHFEPEAPTNPDTLFTPGDFQILDYGGPDSEIYLPGDPVDWNFNDMEIEADLMQVNAEIEARNKFVEDNDELDVVARPGAYVEFRDESPGASAIWTAVVGPFDNVEAAQDYAQLNPQNLAGLRTIFTL